MGDQLDLFTGRAIKQLAVAPAQEEPVADPVAEDSPPDPRQMDLFSDRWLRTAAAHTALQSFDLKAAAAALAQSVKLYPSDEALKERTELIAKLARALRRAEKAKGSSLAALASLEPKVPTFLLEAWHRRLAQETEREEGEGKPLDGLPSGVHWLRAGEAARAERSFRAMLEREPADSRVRAYLGDALTAQERVAQARKQYRDALAGRPQEIDLAAMLDASVRGLLAVAELDYEVSGPPVEWAAAAGIIEGVFLPPTHVPAEWTEPASLEAVPPGVRFYRWLVQERSARTEQDRLTCRRAMRVLCPGMLAAVVQRR